MDYNEQIKELEAQTEAIKEKDPDNPMLPELLNALEAFKTLEKDLG